MSKVVKFGGSSLADAKQFEKVANIIRSDKDRAFVVVSAPGKRFKEDTKVTDMLYGCYESAAKGEDFSKVFEKIEERYRDIISALGLGVSLEKEFERIRQAFIGRAGRDYAASRGEYLNAIIFADYIGYDFIDASDVIFFREDGVLDSEKTQEVLSKELKKHKNAVIPGFYGSMPNDTVRTFSRGGSDITGSIVARAANAEIYENWTDVSGFLMADPRVVESPRPIEVITYHELRELSYMGATVLHEDAIFPVRLAGIPINIRNTNRPEDCGTMIVASVDPNKDNALDAVITGIAGKKGFSVITLEKDMMNQELGFGRRLLEVLEKNNISFEHLPSGIDTMSVVLNTSDIAGNEKHLQDQICRAVDPDSISFEDGLALIAVVGRNMRRAKGTAARVFDAVSNAGVNIRMIDQGSSEINIIIGVSEHDFETAMRAIYKEFIS